MTEEQRKAIDDAVDGAMGAGVSDKEMQDVLHGIADGIMRRRHKAEQERRNADRARYKAMEEAMKEGNYPNHITGGAPGRVDPQRAAEALAAFEQAMGKHAPEELKQAAHQARAINEEITGFSGEVLTSMVNTFTNHNEGANEAAERLAKVVRDYKPENGHNGSGHTVTQEAIDAANHARETVRLANEQQRLRQRVREPHPSEYFYELNSAEKCISCAIAEPKHAAVYLKMAMRHLEGAMSLAEEM